MGPECGKVSSCITLAIQHRAKLGISLSKTGFCSSPIEFDSIWHKTKNQNAQVLLDFISPIFLAKAKKAQGKPRQSKANRSGKCCIEQQISRIN